MMRTDQSGAGGSLAKPDELTFTIMSTSDGQPLAKQFQLIETGELEVTTKATLVQGKAAIQSVRSLEAFAERLEQLRPHEAVVYGVPPIPQARVVTQKQFEGMEPGEREGVITRSREHFQFAHAPGIAMMDFDLSGVPETILAELSSPDQTRDLLIRAVPELAEAPMMWRPSSSSYVYAGDREVQGLRGQRIYIPVLRAAGIPDLGRLLYERLWKNGYGYFTISASGQLLDRTPLDGSVWQPERLDFAAGPVCEPPLERRSPTAKIWNPEADFFNPRSVAGLTVPEQRSIADKRKAARATVREEAGERRRQWAKDRGQEIARQGSIDEGKAIAIATEAVEHGVLYADFLLTTEDGGLVSVGKILADPDTWHNRRFCDPLEPDYRGDTRIAWVNLRPTRGLPYLHSHAHGGTRYVLSHHRKTIRLIDGDLPYIIDQCSELIEEMGEVYELKNQLVRVTDQGRLEQVQPEWLVDRLQRSADFVRLKKAGSEWKERRVDLPLRYSRTLLTKRGEIGIPNLVAVTSGPFLRPDGSVVDNPGFDNATQVLYHATGPSALPVQQDVTLEMAKAALQYLWEPFSKFPFADSVDRGAALALVLTAASRPGIVTAPGGLIESSEAGSGKTLLARAIANLTGVPAIPQALAQSEDEIRKALFSAARAGTPSILYDNIGRERAIDSASLAMVLTSGTVADRILGESTHEGVPLRSLVLLTGNNANLVGDLNRRLLRVRIAPEMENPWTRVFEFDPAVRTEANWRSMRVAALELVRAMLTNGPPQLDEGSGYPEWDFLVRRTVIWIAQNLNIGTDFDDPTKSLLSSYDDDPERDRLRRLLMAWRAASCGQPMTVSQVLGAIQGPLLGVEKDGQPEISKEYFDQLGDVLRDIDPRLNNQAIGIYLNQHKNRIVDGMRLGKVGTRGGSSQWIVHQVSERRAA